ncbi:potassium channel subfamily K member 17 [Alosa alosa]|uniref:potassium channel subfamily K member 17 n=1 Tax=Alosa alosa TaxID=278164 RepID=UPI0020153273|nr:potassium channel subfamily K member 17 [Alosa alosa]
MEFVPRLPSILLLGVVYVAYVLIGGAVFWKLEGELVEQNQVLLRKQKSRLLQRLTCLDIQGLEEVGQLIQSASKYGLSLKSNSTADGFWKFTSSSVFAATVVTTIGYGNISPHTMYGQIFCVFFALVGIPLNVVVLNKVGKYMLSIERRLCDFIEKKTNRKRCVRVLVHSLSFAILAVLYFVAPVMLIQQYEDWSYAEAVYYCFITLSTIGFGDYVADNNPDRYYPEWYGAIMGAWIFFGLAWLALLINHGIDLLERFNGYMKEKREDIASSSQGSQQEQTQAPEKKS